MFCGLIKSFFSGKVRLKSVTGVLYKWKELEENPTKFGRYLRRQIFHGGCLSHWRSHGNKAMAECDQLMQFCQQEFESAVTKQVKWDWIRKMEVAQLVQETVKTAITAKVPQDEKSWFQKTFKDKCSGLFDHLMPKKVGLYEKRFVKSFVCERSCIKQSSGDAAPKKKLGRPPKKRTEGTNGM